MAARDTSNNNISSGFRSFASSIQQNVRNTMHEFTGMDKPRFRASTLTHSNTPPLNNNKSASGVRQYQSGRRRSIDRTGHAHPINTAVGVGTGAGAGVGAGGGVGAPPKYQPRRKRSLLIGRDSYNFGAHLHGGGSSASPPSSDPALSPASSNDAFPAHQLPANFYPPESFVNLLYRITEMESGTNANNTNDQSSRFGLAILDIDNLRGHIQSPLQKQNPSKMQKTLNAPSKANKPKALTNKRSHKKTASMPPTQLLLLAGGGDHKDEEDDDDDDEDDDDDDDEEEEEEESDEDSMSASPLSTEAAASPADTAVRAPFPSSSSAPHGDDGNSNHNDHGEVAMKFIDDEDLISTKPAHHGHNMSSESNTLNTLQFGHEHEHDDTVIVHHHHHQHNDNDNGNDEDEDDDDDEDEDDSSDDYGIATIKPEPKSAAQRTAAINQQRRKSSLLLKQQELAELQAHETALENGAPNGTPPLQNGSRAEQMAVGNAPPQPQQGAYLAVGDTNMDPYLLFWNNSKKGESVVKVVQDILLMSISRDINATHFGFGEFAILANVGSESEFRRILKRVLNKVSSNVHTVKLGPVTLCAGLAMYRRGGSISAWVNQCRQACRLAKTNGRGRIASYVSVDHRRKLAMDLMLEIKKPRVDFSGARVLALIRCGADLNVQFKYDTPLVVAIKKKNEVALRYLMQYEYNPNMQDKKGRTALILALDKECDSLVLELLVSKRDLNPRVKDYHGRSALSVALKKGYRDIAKTLILLGSEPLLGERSVLQKWFSAARVGNIQTIDGMIANMAFPIDMIDEHDMTALMTACQTGHLNLVKYLVKNGANVNIQGHRGYTALMFAIENSKIVIFSLLIQLADILVGLDGDDGTTILMCAAKGQMPEVVHVALHEDNAVEINARNADGNTALMTACMFGSDSVATELLRNHCDMDVKNKLKQNALILCALHGSSQIAAMLCTLGSLIDEQDRDGKTALIYAASRGHMAIAVNLIKYGANVDLADLRGVTALQYASKNGHGEIAKMISTGTLQDVTDLVAQMEILKQKNKALQRNVQSLTEINNELSDRINAAEMAKNQIQKRLTDTMSKMKAGFTSNIHLPNFNKNTSNDNNQKESSASASPPKPNTTQTSQNNSSTSSNNSPQKFMSGMSAGMRSMAGNLNKMFDQNNHPSSNANADDKQKQPQAPSKDMKL